MSPNIRPAKRFLLFFTLALMFSMAACSASQGTSGTTYEIVSPGVGAVRGTSVTVNPPATTTYTLYSINQYGRTTSTVTVTVP